MPITAYPNGVSSFGVPVLPGVPITTGLYFFVSNATNSNGSDGNTGLSVGQPLATIAAAIAKCTANRGDIVIVMPGHAESVVAAAGIDLSIAGVQVIGLGLGSLKPTLTFSTLTTATLRMSASNTKIQGLRFVGNVDDLAMFVTMTTDWCWIEDCDFVTSSGKEALSFIQPTTTKDNFFIKRCTFQQGTDPAGTDTGAGTGCFYIVDSENIFVENCEFYGNFETAIFHNKTTACKNLWVKDCRGVQALSGAEPFQLVDGANGAMLGGGFITPAEAAATEATLVGTLGNSFFVLAPGNFGNDGGAGGQGGIIVATAS